MKIILMTVDYMYYSENYVAAYFDMGYYYIMISGHLKWKEML